ncbi:MAG TPA: helix-turn-helix domain-containing protein [Propionibacteriaceae bacterium]
MNGRRAEAARNDGRILDAAREVFLADPSAPISAVATRASVGMSALYRRYPSKDHLLQQLARDGLERFAADLATALADHGDPWTAYADCLHRVVEGRSQALTQRLAGTFVPTPDLAVLARDTSARYVQLHERTQHAGGLRADVSPGDVVVLLEMLTVTAIPGPEQGAALRRRYLALMLQSLRAATAEPLPGSPPGADDLAARWRRPPQPTPSRSTEPPRR